MHRSSLSYFLQFILHIHVVYYILALCLPPHANATEQQPLGSFGVTPPKRVAVIGEIVPIVPSCAIQNN